MAISPGCWLCSLSSLLLFYLRRSVWRSWSRRCRGELQPSLHSLSTASFILPTSVWESDYLCGLFWTRTPLFSLYHSWVWTQPSPAQPVVSGLWPVGVRLKQEVLSRTPSSLFGLFSDAETPPRDDWFSVNMTRVAEPLPHPLSGFDSPLSWNRLHSAGNGAKESAVISRKSTLLPLACSVKVRRSKLREHESEQSSSQ